MSISSSPRSEFSRNRHGRFRESDILRHLFEATVQTCINEGLVGGPGFACDASLIAADANKQRSLSGEDWDRRPVPENAARAIEEYLATLDDAEFLLAATAQNLRKIAKLRTAMLAAT